MSVFCQFCEEREAQKFFKFSNYVQIRAVCLRCYINDNDDIADNFDYHAVNEIEEDDYIVHLVMDN